MKTILILFISFFISVGTPLVWGQNPQEIQSAADKIRQDNNAWRQRSSVVRVETKNTREDTEKQLLDSLNRTNAQRVKTQTPPSVPGGFTQEAWNSIPDYAKPQALKTLRDREALDEFFQRNPDVARRILSGARTVQDSFDFSSLVKPNTDVFFVGEYHMNISMLRQVNAMILHLGEKKNSGFGFLASEFAFSDQQDVLNAFYDGKIKEKELPVKLGSNIKYTTTFAIAKEQGFLPLGLDLPQVRGNLKWGVSTEGINARNTHWEQLISDRILDAKAFGQNSRVLVHCGTAHATYNAQETSVSVLLEKQGLNVQVLSFEKNSNLSAQMVNPRERNATNPWTRLLSQRFTEEEKVLVPIPAKYKKQLGADYIYYAPEINVNNKKDMRRVKRQAAVWKVLHPNKPAERCILDPKSGVCL